MTYIVINNMYIKYDKKLYKKLLNVENATLLKVRKPINGILII